VETKALAFTLTELKAKDTGWEVAGYASTFGGTPDSYGDIVATGAFADSLLARPHVRLLWQHNLEEPIGKAISLKEDDKGLLGHWSLVPTDTGSKAHQLLHAGLVDSLSIGFMTRDAEYKDDGTRILKNIDLFEVSLVTVPANSNAVVTSFKTDLPFHLLLKQAHDAIALAAHEAKALADRRGADGRSLNDRHIAAIDALLPEAKALVAALDALRVVTPEAKAQASEMALRLQLARARLALRRTA
jgi:Escherichia/Staphylococcus phage prohead protease